MAKRFMAPCVLLFALAAGPLMCVAQSSQEGSTAGSPAHLGKVDFPTSCSLAVQPVFEKAVALMHSFQYQEAQQTFDQAAALEPNCAMAHWGKAMVLHEQLWTLPDKKALSKGHKESELAQKLHPGTPKEQGFVAAAAAYYQKNSKISYSDRNKAYSAALEKLHEQMPDDVEVGSFYALSLVTLAEDDVDSLENQKKAIAILQPLLEKYPDHPGVAHYLIHAADRPELAALGLEAARRYAAIAPDSPHALHMPSHIFTRLGLWQESIDSNIASARAAQKAGMPGEQLHASDYLEYAYLQTGQDQQAKSVLDQMVANKTGLPNYFAGVYATAAMPARYVVETHRWAEAAKLEVPSGSPGGKLSWAEATVYYARALGSAHTGDIEGARQAIQKLEADRDTLTQLQETYWAGQVEIQRREAAGILASAQGKKDEALGLLRSAADIEDASEKHPVTPGPVKPARELLGEFLLTLDKPADALVAFESTLQRSPNRFNALYGAATAAQTAGQREKARHYFQALVAVSDPLSQRPELSIARSYLQEVARK